MEIQAYIGPNGENLSRRQARLSRDALDILAFVFDSGFLVSEILPLPITAVEVMIGPGDVDRILNGGEGFRKHGGSDSLHYFRHVEDEEWALVFAHDCSGNSERGGKLLEKIYAR